MVLRKAKLMKGKEQIKSPFRNAGIDEKTCEKVTDVVVGAGELLVEYFGKTKSVPKGASDVLANADTISESFMVEELLHLFAGHQIIAEESTSDTTNVLQDYCWVIDPLDGTVNLVTNIPFFCVSLAFLYRGEPVLGWVFDPIRRELFQAKQGTGSFLNGRRFKGYFNTTLPIPIGGNSGFLEHIADAKCFELLEKIMKTFKKIRTLGSQALHLCYVAAGRLQAAISWESKIWDDAAGALVVQEAGGCYTDFGGNDIFPIQRTSVLLKGEAMHSVAAFPDVHQKLVGFLADIYLEGNKK